MSPRVARYNLYRSQDPIQHNGPFGEWSVNSMPTLPGMNPKGVVLSGFG